MKAKPIVRGAIIAALYVTLTLALAPISFGPVQIRLSEALTLLVVLCPEAIPGVTLGCFLSNMLASAPIDMLVGSCATLLAALASYKLRHIRWHGLALAAAIPPVVFNAVIVGIELSVLFGPAVFTPSVYLFNILTVGLGQIVSCGLGVLLVWGIEKNPSLARAMIS